MAIKSRFEAQAALYRELNPCAPDCTFTVASGCMAPAVATGDRVVVRACRPAELRVGDVVLLRQDGHVFLHRFLQRYERAGQGYLICKSDRRRRPDPLWAESALLGRLAAIEGRDSYAISAGRRLKAWCYGWFCRLGMAVGVLPPQPKFPPEELADPVSCRVQVRAQNLTWELQFHASAPQPDAALLAELRAASGAEGSADARARVVVFRGLSAGPFAWPEQAGGSEAPGLRVGLAAELAGGTVAYADEVSPRVAINAFFRLAAIALAEPRPTVLLHASSALTADGRAVQVFVGPSGCGKSTSARACGPAAVVDEDFVMLTRAAGGESGAGQWQRVPWSPLRELPELQPLPRALPVRAIYRPQAAADFGLTRLVGGEALAHCLHLPPEGVGDELFARRFAAVCELVGEVPVYRLCWHKQQPLGELLAGANAAFSQA